MAEGHIRKGFFFYFGLFILMLVTAFLICLVIMMFNPGTTVLWMQYFTGNQNIYASKTTGENGITINWNTLTNLEINCSYANITVQRNNDDNYIDGDGIYIKNYAKGFAAASNAQQFSYELTLEGSTLKLTVNEPKGFLYFSKDIQIILHASTKTSSTYNFSGLNLKINGGDGSVILGNDEKRAEDVRLASLDVSTTGGDIIVKPNLDTTALANVLFKTESGEITSHKEITYATGKTANGLFLNCDATLESTKGSVSLGAVSMAGREFALTNKKGNVVIDFIYASNVNCIRCEQGNYKFGDINGNLLFSYSEDTLISPNILANYISGNFSIVTKKDGGSSPKIDIKKIDGSISVIADNGKLNVKNARGAINVDSGDSLGVDLVIEDGNNNTIRIINNHAEVKLGFLGSISKDVSVKTDNGKVIFNVTNAACFEATMMTNPESGEAEKVAIDKIILNPGTAFTENGVATNPLQVQTQNGSVGKINVATNANIEFNLVAETELAA